MSEAKLRSHVPKFGDWDNGDLPYTTYFENARKEKAGIRMNPNDPEENPEVFMYTRGGPESNYDGRSAPVTADKHHRNAANKDGSSYDHQKSARRQRNTALEPENNTGSDRSILHSNHRRRNSGQKNGRPGGSAFSASVSGQSQRNGNHQLDGNKHHRTASVPKFGEWDETDPTSGEGFTVIFNQLKEEKQAPPSSNYQTVAPEVKTMNYSKLKRCSQIELNLFDIELI
ncbi:RPM1-interacting protein 4-like [Gossypium australe]|uniref:RPM1-interacting protein 4-like n=1 Tax=Gossypium australe TaxID=47621 RepID=A0A5B6WAI4_9ROSI|nr:RPM1-interacting protein 4-like [Gossypium australe]